MLNYEKYKQEAFNQTDKPAMCYIYEKILKNNCHDTSCIDCQKIVSEFLYREAKELIKLTKAEYYILKNIDKKYQWIVREKDNRLFLYKDKPYKGNNSWYGENWTILTLFNHLFQFIKWEDEEPYNIQELLNNCEIIQDD